MLPIIPDRAASKRALLRAIFALPFSRCHHALECLNMLVFNVYALNRIVYCEKFKHRIHATAGFCVTIVPRAQIMGCAIVCDQRRNLTVFIDTSPYSYNRLHDCCASVTDIQKNIVYYMKLNIYNILTMHSTFFIIMHNTLA